MLEQGVKGWLMRYLNISLRKERVRINCSNEMLIIMMGLVVASKKWKKHSKFKTSICQGLMMKQKRMKSFTQKEVSIWKIVGLL